jgi:predicted alpha/beta superfamily hydrolase
MDVRRHGKANAALALLLASSACLRTEQAETGARAFPEARIPDSAVWEVTSESGRVYQVQVALPLGYETTANTYPAVYVLDANGQFGMTTEIVRYLHLEDDFPSLIVVGIGYPVGQYFNAIVPRAFDLTPDRDVEIEEAVERFLASRQDHPGLPVTTGGAAGFLTFLIRELIPDVESKYRTGKPGRTLIGHSLGGLFALHTFLEQPDLFEKYLVISPHLGFAPGADRPMLRREAALNASGWSPRSRVYMAVGSNEPAAMIDGATRFADRLTSRAYQNLQWRFSVNPNESHNSVVPGAISTGLRWLHSRAGAKVKPGA